MTSWTIVFVLIAFTAGLIIGMYIASKLIQADKRMDAVIERIDTAELDKKEGWKD